MVLKSLTVALLLLPACSGDDGTEADGPAAGAGDAGEGEGEGEAPEPCPQAEPLTPGWNRLYLQGAGVSPDDDGSFPLLTDRRLIEEGDHFILSEGSFVELSHPIATPLTGAVRVHVAKDSEAGVTARYEVLFEAPDGRHTLASFDDDTPGDKGQVPFDAESAAAAPPTCGRLVARFSNLTGGTLGIVVVPPDYLSWIEVEAADRPHGAD